MSTAHGWSLPAGVTPVAAAAVALGALLAIILLARAVGRLAKAVSAAARPAPAAPKSSGKGRGRLLLAIAAAIGGLVLLSRHHAAALAKAAPPATPASTPPPSPSPSPAVTRTVTQTIAPHVTTAVHHWLTGGDIVAIYIVGAVVAIILAGQAIRRSS